LLTSLSDSGLAGGFPFAFLGVGFGMLDSLSGAQLGLEIIWFEEAEDGVTYST